MDARTLGISWNDGHESVYDTTFLRENCTCAACLDEWSGKRKIEPGMLPKTVTPPPVSGLKARSAGKTGGGVTPVTMDSVGHYGLAIKWNDGHSTGIYTYEHLRKLCQCSKCKS